MKNMSATKELDKFIGNQFISRFYGSGLGAAQMRDQTHDESESYRTLEAACGPQLIREGAIAHWNDCKNAKRTKPDSQQLDFASLPDAPTQFTELKRKNYVPVGNECEEGEGRHLEPENMLLDEVLASAAFYRRMGAEVAKRGEILETLAKWMVSKGISDTTIKQWWDDNRNAA